MGCDIHLFIETRERGIAAGDARIRAAERAGDLAELDRVRPWGPWRLVATHRVRPAGGEPWRDTRVLSDSGLWVWDGRDYCLFHALAGVRTHVYAERNVEPRAPILSPVAWADGVYGGLNDYLYWRLDLPQSGVPEDASAEYRAIAADLDGHSHRWLTPEQVLEAGHPATAGDFDDMCRALLARFGLGGSRLVFYFDN